MTCYTHEFALAFCQATRPLCPDVQRYIWDQVLSQELEVPNAPIKKCSKSFGVSLTNSSNRDQGE